MLSIQNQKIAFRNEMKKKLKLMTSESSIELQSEAVVKKLLQHPVYLNSQSVSLFLNMPTGEIKTDRILVDFFERNKSVFIPCCTKERMEMVRLENWNDYFMLKPNAWGIPEPKLNENRDNGAVLDLIIMPGLAFDSKGNRIGYGKGYYDKYLKRAFEEADQAGKSRPFTIAIGIKEQIVDHLPVEKNDIPPNLILTPNEDIYGRL